MYCPNCGINLKETTQNFCPNCGSELPKIPKSNLTSYTASPVQPKQDITGRPGLLSRKCLGFALASFIMGLVTAVFGLPIIIIFFIFGSIILIITHIVGLKFGITAKHYSKKAAELELPNSAEKAGSVFAVFGIIINAILMGLAIIFTIIFFIIIIT